MLLFFGKEINGSRCWIVLPKIGSIQVSEFMKLTIILMNIKILKVGYLEEKSSGINKVTINNNKLPKDVTISMETLDKDVEGNLVPFIMNIYKATIQRSIDLSFSSEGDPATISLTFDCLQDDDGNVMDFIEITE